jgi:hypothetical protein
MDVHREQLAMLRRCEERPATIEPPEKIENEEVRHALFTAGFAL